MQLVFFYKNRPKIAIFACKISRKYSHSEKNMKKKGLIALGVLFFSVLGVISFQSCDKDTYSYLDVTVIDQNTGRVVPAAAVAISAVGSTVGDFGYTDDEGVYSTKFAAPAVFDISARMFITEIITDTLPNPTRVRYTNSYFHRDGTSSIRLKESETVAATVYIDGDMLSDSVVTYTVEIEEEE